MDFATSDSFANVRPLGAVAVTTLLVVTPGRFRDQSYDTLRYMFRRATTKRRRRFRSGNGHYFRIQSHFMRWRHEHGAVNVAPGSSERSRMRRFVLHIVIYNLRSPLHNVCVRTHTKLAMLQTEGLLRTVDRLHRGNHTPGKTP